MFRFAMYVYVRNNKQKMGRKKPKVASKTSANRRTG